MIEPEQDTDVPSRKAEAPTWTHNQSGKALPAPLGPPCVDSQICVLLCSPAMPLTLVVLRHPGGLQVLAVTLLRALVMMWLLAGHCPQSRAADRRHACAGCSFSCLCLVHEGPGDVEALLRLPLPWLEGLSGCEGPRIQAPVVGGLLGASCLLSLMTLFEVISQVRPHSPDGELRLGQEPRRPCAWCVGTHTRSAESGAQAVTLWSCCWHLHGRTLREPRTATGTPGLCRQSDGVA